MKTVEIIEQVRVSSPAAVVLLGWQTLDELIFDLRTLGTLMGPGTEPNTICGRRFIKVQARRHFEILDVPPTGLEDFLFWAAGELEKRDQLAGNFSAGVAQSLRGRALILEHVRKSRE